MFECPLMILTRFADISCTISNQSYSAYVTKFVFDFWVEDRKLVNRFFNIFRFFLFIREIWGSNSDFRENVSKMSRINKSLGRACCDVA
jgi:hypothetical protein